MLLTFMQQRRIVTKDKNKKEKKHEKKHEKITPTINHLSRNHFNHEYILTIGTTTGELSGETHGCEWGSVATSEYKLSFSIFTASISSTDEEAVWGPQEFPNVPVIRGHFNVILGPVDKNGKGIAEAFAGDVAYLEITVGDDPPISPRQRILSTPYALLAEKAKHHSNFIPVGIIAPFWGTIAPDGWLLCDGKTSLIGNFKYEQLKNLVGEIVPDLRGMFLRGKNNARNDGKQDPERERNIGSYQQDELRSHYHLQGYDDTALSGKFGRESGGTHEDTNIQLMRVHQVI